MTKVFWDTLYELVESPDDVLEKQNERGTEKDEEEEVKAQKILEDSTKLKQEEKVPSQLASQVESLTKSITSSVDKIGAEIRKMTDGAENVAKVTAFKKYFANLDEKIAMSLISKC